jgi:hypothetical protein
MSRAPAQPRHIPNFLYRGWEVHSRRCVELHIPAEDNHCPFMDDHHFKLA